MLKLTNIHTFYGKVEVLKGISMNIERGEIVTLIGANGAGKTTTLKTITGLLKPQQGEIIFNNENITILPAYKVVGKGISMVPEGRKIFSKLTVEENLMMGAYLRNNKKEVANDLEEIYSIFDILKRRRKQLGGTLSGGEQQMLAIGRSLMAKPQLLLLDEPSMGLSPIFLEKIFTTIKQINSTGVTILLVEQNANQALKISHRGYVLEVGEIIFSGNSKELAESELVKKAYLGEV